jgi:hypothetical protein
MKTCTPMTYYPYLMIQKLLFILPHMCEEDEFDNK